VSAFPHDTLGAPDWTTAELLAYWCASPSSGASFRHRRLIAIAAELDEELEALLHMGLPPDAPAALTARRERRVRSIEARRATAFAPLLAIGLRARVGLRLTGFDRQVHDWLASHCPDMQPPDAACCAGCGLVHEQPVCGCLSPAVGRAA
jgi:hypothetical protein